MKFDELIQLQALKLKATTSGRHPELVDSLLDSAPEGAEIRQMCAKVTAALYTRLDETCNALGMSKREFIESAVAEALQRAAEIMERHNVMGEL